MLTTQRTRVASLVSTTAAAQPSPKPDPAGYRWALARQRADMCVGPTTTAAVGLEQLAAFAATACALTPVSADVAEEAMIFVLNERNPIVAAAATAVCAAARGRI